MAPPPGLRPTHRLPIAVGLVLQISAGAAHRHWPGAWLPGIVAVGVVGTAILLLGTIRYAKWKGWPVAVGFLGLFGPIGVVTLWQLHRRPTPRRRGHDPV